eukprot:2893627-Prymnesium_polylepis.1
MEHAWAAVLPRDFRSHRDWWPALCRTLFDPNAEANSYLRRVLQRKMAVPTGGLVKREPRISPPETKNTVPRPGPPPQPGGLAEQK